MKINNELLNTILLQTEHERETEGVYIFTPSGHDDGFCIDFRHNIGSTQPEGLTFFMGDTNVNLSNNQLTIIFLYGLNIYNQEQYSDAEHKRRSMDCDYDDRGVRPSDFLRQ